MDERYNIHKDFEVAKYINIPLNPASAAFINSLNGRAIDKMDHDGQVTVTNHKILSNDGTKVNLKIFRPVGAEGKLPCIINYNGGGFMLKSSPTLVKVLVEYCVRLNCAAVMVEYRVGVNNPFPKGFEDAYAGLKWVWEHGSAYGIDTNRLVVAGESAGGALAAAVCLRARDLNGPKVKMQLLLYPVTDYTQSQPSMKDLYDSPIWNAEKNKKMWQFYLKNGYSKLEDVVSSSYRIGNTDELAYASPLWAADHTNLPPMYIEVAEFDCLRDEGIAYAEKLRDAGNEVALYILEGAVHGYDNFVNSSHVDIFVDMRIESLKQVFS